MNIAIIYHDADFDGKLSNEVCRYWLAKLHPDATIHSYGWDYGRPVPTPFGPKDKLGMMEEISWSDYDQIYIVDLSIDELMPRPELCNKIIWIDHHKSAIEKWDSPQQSELTLESGRELYVGTITPRLNGYRIDGVAACRLCWQWFTWNATDLVTEIPGKEAFINRTVTEPELIRLAGEYDVWDHRDPDAKALQFGLRSLGDRELATLVESQFVGHAGDYAGYGSTPLISALASGYAIKSYCDKQNDEYAAAFSQTIQWEGLTFCALSIGQRGNSDLLRGGIKPEHDACFAWRWTGNAVLVSLYHAPGKEHHDLSIIATKYGGGGHKGACGFRLSLARLESIIASE